MANRIVGNVYIIDSSGVLLSWPATFSNIKTAALYSTDSTGELLLTQVATTTSDGMIWLVNPFNAKSTVSVHFGDKGVPFSQLRVQTLTVGTGFLYLA